MAPHLTPCRALRRGGCSQFGCDRYDGLASGSATEDQPGGRYISGHAKRRSALRRLRQFPGAERVQIRSRQCQPKRLVPAVYPEKLVTASTSDFTQFGSLPWCGRVARRRSFFIREFGNLFSGLIVDQRRPKRARRGRGAVCAIRERLGILKLLQEILQQRSAVGRRAVCR